MQLLSVFAILAPALTVVQAGCYSPAAPPWGSASDQQRALEFVDEICNGNGGIGGYFAQGQTKYKCHQRGDRHMFNFWVQWRGQGGLTLNDNDCKTRLKNEINGCKYGGESVVSDWFFRSDPNTGAC